MLTVAAGVDDTPPTAEARGITVELDANGIASITADQIDNGSTEACGIASLSLDRSSFGCGDGGANTVVLTVTDVNAIVPATQATVSVEDNVDPVPVAKDITLQLDAAGAATITAAEVNDGSCDACCIAGLSVDSSSFGCENVGANNLTLTVTNENGNQSTAPASVTVEDNVAPQAYCQPISVYLHPDGTYTLSQADAIAIGSQSTDACVISDLSVPATTFSAAGDYLT